MAKLILSYFAMYVFGVLVGILITKFNKKPDGAFRVNLSDPMKDVFTLELYRPIEGIQNCKNLYFVVVNDSEPSSREKQRL